MRVWISVISKALHKVYVRVLQGNFSSTYELNFVHFAYIRTRFAAP